MMQATMKNINVGDTIVRSRNFTETWPAGREVTIFDIDECYVFYDEHDPNKFIGSFCIADFDIVSSDQYLLIDTYSDKVYYGLTHNSVIDMVSGKNPMRFRIIKDPKFLTIKTEVTLVE